MPPTGLPRELCVIAYICYFAFFIKPPTFYETSPNMVMPTASNLNSQSEVSMNSRPIVFRGTGSTKSTGSREPMRNESPVEARPLPANVDSTLSPTKYGSLDLINSIHFPNARLIPGSNFRSFAKVWKLACPPCRIILSRSIRFYQWRQQLEAIDQLPKS